ncbi:hypothetical protein EID71_10830 [Salmonella enterica subsp. indica serovar 11:b:e,n,x]|nr:hypothetical protein [Salmonella enterica subsp. indica serovar 11:b:e,n,x]
MTLVSPATYLYNFTGLISKNPPAYTDGFLHEEVKLTDKPLSFRYSVVGSHSSCRPVKAKTRQLTLTGFCMKR